MVKPEIFQKPYVALGHIPYVCGESSSGTSGAGGVLSRGQTVWTAESYEPRRAENLTSVFVEDIGVISLDPHWLVRADVLKP